MRAGKLFLVALAAALGLLLVVFVLAIALHAKGTLSDADAHLVLRITRDLVLPVGFVALGALLWHFVRFYQGAYARR